MAARSCARRFDGPPFPMRLRMVLERASSLAEARAVWEASNNTDSMNYLIASANDAAAYAIEAIGGRFGAQPPHAAYSAFFTDDDPTEAGATCAVGETAGGTCGGGFPDHPVASGLKHIGRPLREAVWRTNHAVHPLVMATQEPLFNDTGARYDLLHDLIDGHAASGRKIGDTEAVAIAATLGIKGPDFYSCDPAQFKHGEHVMSVVYAPGAAAAPAAERAGHAWVAWEDATPSLEEWRPAACNAYVRIDFARFW
jgi:hypothetical protein